MTYSINLKPSYEIDYAVEYTGELAIVGSIGYIEDFVLVKVTRTCSEGTTKELDVTDVDLQLEIENDISKELMAELKEEMQAMIEDDEAAKGKIVIEAVQVVPGPPMVRVAGGPACIFGATEFYYPTEKEAVDKANEWDRRATAIGYEAFTIVNRA